MRLDRFLCEMNLGSRSQVKNFLKQGLVTVNGIPTAEPDMKIDENSDQVSFQGRVLDYRKYVYYMLNKPVGVVSAVTDNTADTVVSLLKEEGRKDLFPAGRLDKDTTGLLLLTNDGELVHRLLSPRRHVDKIYQVTLEHPLKASDLSALETGIRIGEEHPTLPAKVTVLGENRILLTLHEGRFHQVKRMMLALGNGVRTLRRISFGGLQLDERLKEGEYRELTPSEIQMLKEAAGLQTGADV